MLIQIMKVQFDIAMMFMALCVQFLYSHNVTSGRERCLLTTSSESGCNFLAFVRHAGAHNKNYVGQF
jgi:hypothetical protein